MSDLCLVRETAMSKVFSHVCVVVGIGAKRFDTRDALCWIVEWWPLPAGYEKRQGVHLSIDMGSRHYPIF